MTGQISAAVEKRREAARYSTAQIERYKNEFAQVVPSHVSPDAFVRLAQGAVRRADQRLMEAITANPGSLMTALLDCAQLGLRLGDTYHLTPRGGKQPGVVGIVDYTGEIELMYRTGVVASVKCELVREKDRFEFAPGRMDRPNHEVDWFGERGDKLGGYAYAIFNTGALSRVVVMSKEEIAKHKAMAQGTDRSDSPWVRWEDAMWLKTLVHQVRKWAPSSPEYLAQALRAQKASEIAEEHELPVNITGITREVEGADEGLPLPNESEPIDAELVDSPAP